MFALGSDKSPGRRLARRFGNPPHIFAGVSLPTWGAGLERRDWCLFVEAAADEFWGDHPLEDAMWRGRGIGGLDADHRTLLEIDG